MFEWQDQYLTSEPSEPVRWALSCAIDLATREQNKTERGLSSTQTCMRIDSYSLADSVRCFGQQL